LRVGDLGLDTAVEALGDGRYRASVSRDWEIWGPMGGYMASFALRAAGAESSFGRPASFFCHYLGVAAFDEIAIAVTKLRGGRNAESFRVAISQGDRPIMEATVWTVADVDGLEHDLTTPPDVPDPDGLPTLRELRPDEEPYYPFWANLDAKPIGFHHEWPPTESLDPIWREWERFVPAATFDDPWVDACRALVLIDVCSWPSATRHHAWKWHDGPQWVAPSLDLYVAFHEACPEDEWLMIDGLSPLAKEGLVAWNGRLWSTSRRLIASGTGQLLCRRLPPPT
jgi:acyl-CoA thioesterase-2